MNPITALNIARAEQRIAILRNLIATLGSKGHDVSEHQRFLALEEAYLARGCTPRGHQPKDFGPGQDIAAGWIMPPGAK